MPKKEKIIPPSKPTLTKASEELRKGKSTGARIESEESVAKRQGVKRKVSKKK
jgi:hypothetical protein